MNQGKHHVHKPPAVVQPTSPSNGEKAMFSTSKPGKVQVVVEHMDLHGAKKQPMRFLCVHGGDECQAQITVLSEVLTPSIAWLAIPILACLLVVRGFGGTRVDTRRPVW